MIFEGLIEFRKSWGEDSIVERRKGSNEVEAPDKGEETWDQIVEGLDCQAQNWGCHPAGNGVL